MLDAVVDDPAGFIAAATRPLFIDEVQLAGDRLIRAIKVQVDTDNCAGQFVLTGSADFLTVPTLSESLAGRAAFLELWPFSQGELAGAPEHFVDRLFQDPDSLRELEGSTLSPPDYVERLCRGGFPEVQTITSERIARRWFADYVRTVTQRDITDITNIRRAEELPRLLRLFAARTANEFVIQEIANDTQLGRDTLSEYLGLLRMVYLVHTVPAWSPNFTSRAKRHSKIYISDTGLAAYLLGVNASRLASPTLTIVGPLLETFVLNELRKQLSWSDIDASLLHFQDRTGSEVDIVLEALDGRVVGIEVKKSVTVRTEHFRWLRLLRDKLGANFVHGVVLHAGSRPLPFGDRLTALPISALWQAT